MESKYDLHAIQNALTFELSMFCYVQTGVIWSKGDYEGKESLQKSQEVND